MRAGRKRIISIAGFFPLAYLVAGFLFYSPPLLERQGWNLPGRGYDLLAYVYHITASVWREDPADPVPSLRSAARAAWHRPSRVRDLIGFDPDDLPGLARFYASLGLREEAIRLFRQAAVFPPGEDNRTLEIISCLALLNQWRDVARAAEKLLVAAPESPEANYWLGRALLETGRAGEAAAPLARAAGSAQFRPDALYQAARAMEKSGQTTRARALYEEVAAELPGHREAWKALDRLYAAAGDAARREAVRARWGDLTPAVPLEVSCRNRFILRGYSLSPPVVRTGGTITLTLFLEGWGSGPADLRPEAGLVSQVRPQRISRPMDPVPVPAPGEVLVSTLEWTLPAVVYPGLVDLEVSFLDLESGSSLPLNGSASLPLGSFLLSPAWIPAASSPGLVAEKFGPKARPLGKATFLGPGSELDYTLDREERLSAIGLVSSAHSGCWLPQEGVLAKIAVRTAEAGELVFPIRAGRETAEVWWENCPVWSRGHRLAPIFASWPVDSGGRRFQAHSYWTVFPLPDSAVRSLQVKNLCRKSGIYVGDIVLITPPK